MADGSSNLEILITAVDEASGALDEISESMSSMSDAASAASEIADESLDSVGTTASTVTGVISAAMASQNASFALAADIATQSDQEIIDIMLQAGVSSGIAAAAIAQNNAAIDESSAATATSVTASNDISKASFVGLGVFAGIALNGIMDAIGNAISSAQQWDQTSAIISQGLKDIGASTPVSAFQAYAQQIQATTLFTQQQALSAESVIAGNKQLEPSYQNLTSLAADLATKVSQFGGAAADMPSAMKIIANSLSDPVAGLSQLQRQAGIEFPAATVTMIKNLANMGDTSAADSVILAGLKEQVGGMAQAAAAAPGGGLIQLENALTALGTYIGNTLLPALDSIAKDIEPIISAIANWVQQHPKLTEAIIAAMVVFTALIAIITVIGIVVFAVGSTFALVAIAISAAVAVIVGIVVDNWDLIEKDTKELFSFLEGVAELGLDAFQLKWSTVLSGLVTIAQNIWNAIGNTFKTGIDYVIQAINGFINALDALHISIPSISIPGTKLATPAVNLGFSIPDIPMLAEGGFVTQPTLAIIGEAGPEAVVPLSRMGGAGASGGQQIVININGGIFPADQSAIKQIGDLLAKSILTQIRVSNYQP